MNQITFTVITAQKPRVLSKSFTLEKDGSLLKHAGGQLAEGTSETRTCTVKEFATLLEGLSPAQALLFGIAEYQKAIIIPQAAVGKRKASTGSPVIARDREHFRYSSDPGLMMLDYDPEMGTIPLDPEKLLQTLYEVWQALKDRSHVWTPSASSCIHMTESGKELRGIIGQRVYVPVQDARDIPRAGHILFQRLWLAGHGRFDVSKSGALLERSLIDSAVWQPERLDFAGGAQCGPGLEQRRPDPLVCNPDKPFIDSRTLRDVMPDERKLLEDIKATARKAKKPEMEQRREEWITERLADLKPEDAARWCKILESAVREKRLLGDFVLHSAKHGKVTVATMLDNPAKYHGDRCADPLEPDYGNDKRIAWANLQAAGKPYIWSWAHGGQRYSLHRAVETIRIQGGELPRHVARMLELMRLDGAIFDRGELIRLADGRAFPVSSEWLQVYLTGLARFEKFDARTDAWKQIDCPKDFPKTILSMSGLWKLPPLEGVITAPTITPDGRIIDTDGYDEATGLYLDLGDFSSWPGIPENPSNNAVRDAVECLWHPFKEFPFESPVDRAGFFSALLTVIVRSLLPTAPGFVISSPVAGSGKTLLARSLARLAGCAGEVLPNVQNDDEMRKRLISLARVCTPVIIFDNISGTFESDSLSAFLTSERITDRVLGASSMISGRTNSMVLVTGNNPIVVGDLNRRLLRARINPDCEKPYLRTFSLDPVEFVQKQRLNMVKAALTILKASILSGFRHGKGRLASFEMWSDFIRNAVIWVKEKGWLTVADPVESIEQSYEADPDAQRLSALLCAWGDEFPSGATVSQAIRRARGDGKNDMGNSELFSVLNEVAGERGVINPRLLGWWIRRHDARIVDGRRFVRCGERRNAVAWKCELCEFGEFSLTPHEKSQNDTLYKGIEKTGITNTTHTCDTCINFSSNGGDSQHAFGVCERTHGGRPAKLPSDGTDCPAFERVTH